jgi:hypothetical protein
MTTTRYRVDMPIVGSGASGAAVAWSLADTRTVIYTAHWPRLHPSDFRVSSLEVWP